MRRIASATNWRLAAELWILPKIIGEALYPCAGSIWVVFALLFITKRALARDEALAEFSNPCKVVLSAFSECRQC